MEALPLAAAALFGSLEASTALILTFPGDVERRIVQYDCGEEQPLTVDYINAAPNYLAIVTTGGQKLVFVTVLSGSGARYAAGEYEWWNKGSEGTLTNLTTPDAEPLVCTEMSETP
jgi:membrane-bound inhibitor of C-type lysozyme